LFLYISAFLAYKGLFHLIFDYFWSRLYQESVYFKKPEILYFEKCLSGNQKIRAKIISRAGYQAGIRRSKTETVL